MVQTTVKKCVIMYQFTQLFIYLFVLYITCNNKAKQQKMVLLNSGNLYVSFLKKHNYLQRTLRKFLDTKTRKFLFGKYLALIWKSWLVIQRFFRGCPYVGQTLLSLKWLFSWGCEVSKVKRICVNFMSTFIVFNSLNPADVKFYSWTLFQHFLL